MEACGCCCGGCGCTGGVAIPPPAPATPPETEKRMRVEMEEEPGPVSMLAGVATEVGVVRTLSEGIGVDVVCAPVRIVGNVRVSVAKIPVNCVVGMHVFARRDLGAGGDGGGAGPCLYAGGGGEEFGVVRTLSEGIGVDVVCALVDEKRGCASECPNAHRTKGCTRARTHAHDHTHQSIHPHTQSHTHTHTHTRTRLTHQRPLIAQFSPPTPPPGFVPPTAT